MSERLNLSDLDQLAKNANRREVSDASKRALDSLKSQISVLKNDHGIVERVEWKNATQVLRNIMVEILTSNEWLTIKKWDQLSYINGLLPKWYHINFNPEASFVKIWDKVRVVVRDGTVKLISIWSWEEKDIWTLSQWPNNQEPDQKLDTSIEIPKSTIPSEIKDTVKDEPIAVKDEPIAVKDEPIVVKDKPIAVKDESIVVKDKPINDKKEIKTSLPYSIDASWKIIYEKNNTWLLSSVRDIFSKIYRDQLQQINAPLNSSNTFISVKDAADILDWKGFKMPKLQTYSLVSNKGELYEAIIKFPDYKIWDLVIKEVKWEKVKYYLQSKTSNGWWDSANISIDNF